MAGNIHLLHHTHPLFPPFDPANNTVTQPHDQQIPPVLPYIPPWRRENVNVPLPQLDPTRMPVPVAQESMTESWSTARQATPCSYILPQGHRTAPELVHADECRKAGHVSVKHARGTYNFLAPTASNPNTTRQVSFHSLNTFPSSRYRVEKTAHMSVPNAKSPDCYLRDLAQEESFLRSTPCIPPHPKFSHKKQSSLLKYKISHAHTLEPINTCHHRDNLLGENKR